MMPIYPGSTAPTILLDYAPSTDIADTLSVPGSTFTAIHTNQSFTVAKDNALIAVSVRGVINLSSASAIMRCGASILLDSAGSPARHYLGGWLMLTAGQFVNILAGANTIWLPGMTVGSHTIRVEAVASVAADAYCRASSQSTYEYLMIQILEF